MRVLVAIANHGTGKRQYLDRVLREYRAMPYRVDVVIFSDIPKDDLGPGVEVIVGLPTRDPWSLPYGHKQLFADRRDDYDLFIYSEDDILITAANIDAYLRATAVLRDDEITGFMPYETGPDGRIYFPEVHSGFHWAPGTVRRRGPYTFAYFTNEHACCYALTKRQLHKAVESGGFLVGPHRGRYDLLVSAATDPYTQCGFVKLLCASHLQDFLVAHLPNKYLDTLGLEATGFYRQIDVMLAAAAAGQPPDELFPTAVQNGHRDFWAVYYPNVQRRLLDLVPPDARTVLSVGCGWGAPEEHLQATHRNLTVTAVPLDPIIAVGPRERGIETVCGGVQDVRRALDGRRFDCVLFPRVLQIVPDPVAALATFAELLADGGTVVVSVPNMNALRMWRRRLAGRDGYADLGDLRKTGVHRTTRTRVSRWFRAAGLRLDRIDGIAPDAPGRQWPRPLATLAAHVSALDLAFVGRPLRRHPVPVAPGARSPTRQTSPTPVAAASST